MAIVHEEWLNQNAYRAYPFAEDTLRTPITGTTALTDVRIPDYIFVDIVLTVAAQPNPVQGYISQLAYVGTTLAFVISDQNQVELTSMSIDLAAHTTNKQYPITGVGQYEDARGTIVLGDLGEAGSKLADDFIPGSYNFDFAATTFEPSTIRPALRGVRSLALRNINSDSDLIQGHVKLLAGSNINLTYESEINAIRIDSIVRDGLTGDCECEDIGNVPTPIKTINGIAVENLTITGDGRCVEIITDTAGSQIVISDTCSTPCCGCPELDAIAQAIADVNRSVTTVETFASTLESKINTFVNNVILTIAGT